MSKEYILNSDKILVGTISGAEKEVLLNPEDGVSGQVLTKTDDGEEWSDPIIAHNQLTGRDTSDAHPISAITGLTSELSKKYEKPDSGIPKSDLSTAVQDDLDLAHSALQEVPNTYRTAAQQDIIDASKQDLLIEGDGISITNNVISSNLDHTELYNRDATNSHPISAITNLQTELDEKYEKPSSGIPTSDLADVQKVQLVETEQIDELPVSTSITSESTDSEIPTTKAVYDFVSSAEDSSIFIVTVQESSGTYTADHTYSEITTAKSSGKVCVVLYNGNVYQLSGSGAGGYYFDSIYHFAYGTSGASFTIDDGDEVTRDSFTHYSDNRVIVYDSAPDSIALYENTTVVINYAAATLAYTINATATPNTREFICGINFTAQSGQTVTETINSAYAIHYSSVPTWTAGKTYEIIYRNLWLKDSNDKYIVSATWNEV